MIGILLPMTALGLMLRQPFNTLRTKPLIAPGTGTRAVVPLTMVGGFAEDLENKITEAAEKKIKEAEGLVETNFEDLEYKTKADIAELSRLDKQQMLEAVEKLVEGEDVGLPSGQFELLKKILQVLNVPVILGEIIQLVELLLELGREGIDLQLLLQALRRTLTRTLTLTLTLTLTRTRSGGTTSLCQWGRTSRLRPSR